MVLPELKRRRDKIRSLMAQQHIDAALMACNVNLHYTCGQILNGYLYLPLNSPGRIFVKRPNNLTGEHIHPIRKPEQIIEILKEQGLPAPGTIMLEGDELSWSEYNRLAAMFPGSEVVNGTPVIRQARSVKTEMEVEMFRRAGMAHTRAYENIPSVYREGMTDVELSIEIERLMRLEGNLGIFRTFGRSMEIFMGSLLVGDNAAEPSPFDFALGGKGTDPSMPVGASGVRIQRGHTVMVDYGGNFNSYMCDMTRVFSVGRLPEEAYMAHQVCLDVQETVVSLARPGAICEELYNAAVEVVAKAGLSGCFMGIGQKAGFIGHGIGLEINEAPVLAPRIKTELEAGMVFALEPKIVLPGIGAVGIENSWAVTTEGVEKLTPCREEIVDLLG
ncbi:MAG: Xaa-Pro peptidase family protein [Mediterranea sp.]|jgi:Xaa-Pro aminopeptidase|nr:Xaa-Pro peptidase family protein [Mediterranea sp.]